MARDLDKKRPGKPIRNLFLVTGIGAAAILFFPRSCAQEPGFPLGIGVGTKIAAASPREAIPERSPEITDSSIIESPFPGESFDPGEERTTPRTFKPARTPTRPYGRVAKASHQMPTRADRNLFRREEEKPIRQGEFAVLLLETMRIPRPRGGWEPRMAACTLAAENGCGEATILAMRRQFPFPDEEGERGKEAISTPYALPGDRWLGEDPVWLSSGWRVQEFLTEGELAGVMNQLGVPIHTARPERLVTWKLARRILGRYQGVLAPRRSRVEERLSENRNQYQPPRGNPGPRQVMSASVP